MRSSTAKPTIRQRRSQSQQMARCSRCASRPRNALILRVRSGAGASGSKFQQEVEQPGFVPIDLAEIGLRLEEPDLVADPMCHHGRLGIVQYDAVLAVEPA